MANAWMKAQAVEVGFIASIPRDDGSPHSGEILWKESIDPSVLRLDFRDRSVWVHPEEKIEILDQVVDSDARLDTLVEWAAGEVAGVHGC